MKSWKTTVAGIAAIMAAVAGALAAELDGDPSTSANWAAVIAAVVAGFGLIAARDNDKTSEDVGAN